MFRTGADIARFSLPHDVRDLISVDLIRFRLRIAVQTRLWCRHAGGGTPVGTSEVDDPLKEEPEP
jgi:hypothetical protein